jgi:rod shape-determining protein MreC
MLRRPHYVALSLIVLTTLVVLNLSSGATARFKLAISSFFLPLFGLAATSQNLVNHVGDSVVPRRELLRQNEQLRRENQQLQLVAMPGAETARENNRLRQLVGWRDQSPWKGRLKLARVVLREPANWWRSIQIDLGSRDGLRTDLPVLTVDGLVGRVATVGLGRSQVVLIGDPNCKFSALVDNPARETGVVGPAGPVESDWVVLSFLPPSATLKPGQNVVTSGLGGIFPKGIPVGKVMDARPVEYGLYVEARLKLAANLNALEEVWVLLP